MMVPAFLRGFPPLLRSSSGINQSLLQEYTEISPPQRGLPGPLHPKPLSPPITRHPTATSGFFPAVTSRAGDLSLPLQIDVHPPKERSYLGERWSCFTKHLLSCLLSPHPWCLASAWPWVRSGLGHSFPQAVFTLQWCPRRLHGATPPASSLRLSVQTPQLRGRHSMVSTCPFSAPPTEYRAQNGYFRHCSLLDGVLALGTTFCK